MASGEGGDGVHEEFRCPVCNQGGFSTLRGAAEHCTGQATEASGGPEENEETASSVKSADTQMIVDEIRTLRTQQEKYREEDQALLQTWTKTQSGINVEDRKLIRETRQEVLSEALNVISNVTDSLRGEMTCREARIDDLEKQLALKDSRIEKLENNVAWIYLQVKEKEKENETRRMRRRRRR